MSQYSEMMGSFVRTGSYPLEADLIFDSKEALDQWALNNTPILHEGLFKIVIDDVGQKLFWAVKEGTDFKFKEVDWGKLTKEITPTNITVGNIKDGQVLPEGMTFTEFVTKLLINPKLPTLVVNNFINNSVNLDQDGEIATVEVGTKVTGAKATYTQFQGGYLQSAICIITGFLDSHNDDLFLSENTIVVSFGDRIKEGVNTIKFTVEYSESRVFPQGQLKAQKNIIGARKYFIGNGIAPSNNTGIRNSDSVLSTESFNYTLDQDSLWIAIPSNKEIIKIIDTDAFNANITSNFKEVRTILVDGATPGKDAINYTIYQLTGYGPFSNTHIFTFIIE